MAETGLRRIIQHLRVVEEARHGESSDAQLIERFVTHRDEAAFATLVQRHGPMVRAVCQRQLPDVHDTEDAVQATFVVFLRKAGTLSRRERVAAWLHGVALRVARKARVLSYRHQSGRVELRDVPGPDSMSELAWRELQSILDDEIGRLPAKYREPVILCYLEGLSYTATARRLGVPAGTISGWLDRARALLRSRLLRRGFLLSAALLDTLVAQNATAATLPRTLLQSIVKTGLAGGGQAAGTISSSALQLADATLRSLYFAQLQLLAAVLLPAVLLVATGLAWQYGAPGQVTAPANAAPPGRAHAQPAPAPAGRAPSEAQKIVQRAIAAMGGRTKVAALQSVTWTTVWNPDTAEERKQRFTVRGHDQYILEFERPGAGKGEINQYIVNRNVGWRRAANGQVAEMPSALLSQHKEHIYALRLSEYLTLLEDERVTLTLLGEKTFDQRAATGIRAERPGFPTVQLYFDHATGLLHRSEAQPARSDGTQRTVVYVFEDYRDTAGLVHFTRVTSRLGDEPEAVGHVRDFRILTDPNDQLFERP